MIAGPSLNSGAHLRVATTRSQQQPKGEPVYGRHGAWAMPQTLAVVLPQLASSPVSGGAVHPSPRAERQWAPSAHVSASQAARCCGWGSSSRPSKCTQPAAPMMTPRRAAETSPRAADGIAADVVRQDVHAHADAHLATERHVSAVVEPAIVWLHGYIEARILRLEVKAPAVVEREQQDAFDEITQHVSALLEHHFPHRLPSALWGGILSLLSHLEGAGLSKLFDRFHQARLELCLAEEVVEQTMNQSDGTRRLLKQLLQRVRAHLESMKALAEGSSLGMAAGLPPDAVADLRAGADALERTVEDLTAGVNALAHDHDSSGGVISSSQPKYPPHATMPGALLASCASDHFERGLPLESQSAKALAKRVVELGQELVAERDAKLALQAMLDDTARRLRDQTMTSMVSGQSRIEAQNGSVRTACPALNACSFVDSHSSSCGLLSGATQRSAATGATAPADPYQAQHTTMSVKELHDALRHQHARNSKLEQFAKRCRAVLGEELASEIESQCG